MKLGCGRAEDRHGQPQEWTQADLVTAVRLSQRMIYSYLYEEKYPGRDRWAFILDALGPKSDRQREAVDRLRRAFDSRPNKRKRVDKQRSADTNSGPLAPIPPDARPYRGLEAFHEEDAHLFFGRNALAQNVLDKLDHHRLVLLIGASGSGKSSLINAGIIPELRQDPARTIVRCTPGDRAIANLAAALARTLDPDRSPAELRPAQQTYKKQLEDDPEAIRDIAQLLPEGRLFLVIDQFEESFTLTRPANPRQHEALIATLLAIARSPDERRLNALLGMRSDFQNELETADPELIQRLDNAMVQMRAMLPPEREAAITEPARAYGVTLEPGLLTAITTDLADNRDALPLLEVTLDELWSRRDDTSRRLTMAAFTEIGGIPGALGQRADSALEHLGLDEPLVRRLFLDLVRVDPEGAATKSTRRPRTRQDLGEALWQLGERLATPGLRLLVTYRDDTTGEQILDVTHEAIFRQWPRLAGWIEEERDFILFCQRLDQRLGDYLASSGDPAYVVPRPEIEQAGDWQEKHGKVFPAELQTFIHGSARHWLEDAAADEARALWGRLELLLDEWDCILEHDRAALAALSTVGREARRRFLALTTTDTDAARKLNRKPELVLRASLGLEPLQAADLGASALAVTTGQTAFEAKLACVTVARHLLPIVPIRPTTIVERALALVTQTTDPEQLQVLVEAIGAMADMLGPDKAASSVDRALELASEITDPGQLHALLQAVAAMAGKLDPAKARHTAASTVDRALELAAETTDWIQFEPLAETIGAMADELDPAKAASTALRALDLAAETTDPDQLHTLAEAFAAIAYRVDPAKAASTVDRALDLAAKTTFGPTLQPLAEAIAAMAGKLDPAKARHAAACTVDRALELARETTFDPALRPLAAAIAIMAEKLDSAKAAITVNRALELAGETTYGPAVKLLAEAIGAMAEKLDSANAARSVVRALDLAAEATDPDQLLALAEAIAAMAQKLDQAKSRDAAASTVERALDLATKTTDTDALQALTQTIATMADKLDPAKAASTVDRALDLAAEVTSPGQLRALAETISAVVDKLDPEKARHAAASTVGRALELAGETTEPDQLQALADTIAATVDMVDAAKARHAATITIERALELAGGTTDPHKFWVLADAIAVIVDQLDHAEAQHAAASIVERALELAAKAINQYRFKALAQAIAAMAPWLSRPAISLTAVHLLKHPLGGDEKVTDTLLRAITAALARPDLLRPFPEQSFWAVMQHLAELKAVNPDWDWLDLARPPLPPDELVATFRRLCADPPDWPTA